MVIGTQTEVDPVQSNEEPVVRHEDTPEENAYFILLEEKQKMLSKTAWTLFEVAKEDSYKYNLSHNYAYQPEQAEETRKLMVLLASDITREDCETLTEIVHAASLAALSIDPGGKALVGHKVDEGDLYWYYKLLCFTIEEVLQKSPPEQIEQIQW